MEAPASHINLSETNSRSSETLNKPATIQVRIETHLVKRNIELPAVPTVSFFLQ